MVEKRLTEDEFNRLLEKARQEGIQEAEEAAWDRTNKLEEGTFFTPLSRVWREEQIPIRELFGAFEDICRADEYFNQVEAYQEIVDKVQKAKEENSDQNEIEIALMEASQDRRAARDAGRNSSSFKGSKKKPKKKRSGSNSSHSTNAENSNASTIADDESGRRSEVSDYSQEGSNVSSSSGLENKDFIGDVPSSRAHLVPNSDCCFPYGVGCQAVCGVKFSDAKSLRKLAEGMVKSDTNFMRSRPVHGELFDTKPCWIFVPICSLDFIMNWKHRQGYSVMAIAGGFEGVGQPITDEKAYSSLCTKHYHKDDERTTGKCFKRLKCKRGDISTATDRLTEMILALAETLVGREDANSPSDLLFARGDTDRTPPRGPDPRADLLKQTRDDMKNRGVMVPKFLDSDFDDSVEILKFVIDPSATDLVPDPMLLLMKAAINWSWRCGQKLLPACCSVHSEGAEEEELVVPSTPIPSFIECPPVPVTPDFIGDDLSLE